MKWHLQESAKRNGRSLSAEVIIWLERQAAISTLLTTDETTFALVKKINAKDAA